MMPAWNAILVESIAIHADDRLVVDWCRLAIMKEPANTARIFEDAAEIEIALGADEIVDGNRNGIRADGRGSARCGKHKRRGDAASFEFHVALPQLSLLSRCRQHAGFVKQRFFRAIESVGT